MAIALEAVRAQVKILLKYKDLAVLPDTDQADIIEKALIRYSRVRPMLAVVEYTGNATGIYSFLSPWKNGFSQITEIEYPVGKTPKETIDSRDYTTDKTPSGHVLRFDQFNPGLGNIFWVKHTAPHSFTSDGVAEEVPDSDQAGIQYLAASLMATALSNHYATKANPSLPGTGLVTYNERVREYADKAREWMKLFEGEIKAEVTGIIGNLDFLQNTYFGREDA